MLQDSVRICKGLLIVYPELDVRIRIGRWRSKRFHHKPTAVEIADAVESFRALPELASNLTSDNARIEVNVITSEQPLRSLTAQSGQRFWPSPDDTRRELDQFAPTGSYDSLFVFWPQNDSQQGTSVPCRGWGLGMGASDWSNGATYAVVGNAPSWMWHREAPGEVWLHEWLHGVCHHFALRGHSMPARDADGAELHGYARLETAGWTQYYRDLMTGRVTEDGRSLGIPLQAWRTDFGRQA